MKTFWRTIAGVGLLAACAYQAGSKAERVSLLPRLQAGQTIVYRIDYSSDKQVSTKSSVVAPMAPNAAQIDVHGILQLKITSVETMGKQSAIHASAIFESLDSTLSAKQPKVEQPSILVARQKTEQPIIEFSLLPDGRVNDVKGLDALAPDQQQAWQEWVSRFAVASLFPRDGLRLSEKWKSEQAETSPAPIAGLVWNRESIYGANEHCRPFHMTAQGDSVETDLPADMCAVIVTSATLRQKSSVRDSTPEDFKLHDLRTSGTAGGTNKSTTYISLKTGLVVRANEVADQQMDVTVATKDGNNRVHYDVHAKSRSSVLLLSEDPTDHRQSSFPQ
jgi:hypothetical protein